MSEKYSTLYFGTKKRFGLSYQEYHYLYLIHKMSLGERWCTASNDYFCDLFDIKERALQKMTKKLEASNLLIKDTGTRKIACKDFCLDVQSRSGANSGAVNTHSGTLYGNTDTHSGTVNTHSGTVNTHPSTVNTHPSTPNSNNINNSNLESNRASDSENKKIYVQTEKVENRKSLPSLSSKQQEKEEKKKEKSSAQKEKPSGADLVDWDNAFWQSADFQWALQKWFEMMKDQHSKTFYSRDMVVERLRNLHALTGATNDNKKESDAVEIIKTSTRKGWKDFYKDSNGKGGSKKNTDSHRIKNDILTEEEMEQKRIADDQSYQDEIERGKSSMVIINEALARL